LITGSITGSSVIPVGGVVVLDSGLNVDNKKMGE
jgi:hypothetical protein